jgi:hypothetical protein
MQFALLRATPIGAALVSMARSAFASVVTFSAGASSGTESADSFASTAFPSLYLTAALFRPSCRWEHLPRF